MFFKLKPIIISCNIVIAFCLQTQMGFAQSKVQDISQEFWSKLPRGYDLSECGLQQNNNLKNVWVGCELHVTDDNINQKDAIFFWLASIQENGKPGNIVRVSAEEVLGNHWFRMLAFGQKDTLLAIEDNEDLIPHVSALQLPSSYSLENLTLKRKWDYVLPEALDKDVHLELVDAQSAPDGGYVLLMQDKSHAIENKKQNLLTIVGLSEQGKQTWRYDHLAAENFLSDEFFSFEGLTKNIFITSDQKTVLYEYINQSASDLGTRLICLNGQGKEISNQFFDNKYWISAQQINALNGEFGFVNYGNKGDKTDFSLSIFDKNCQENAEISFTLPLHNTAGRVHNQIKATVGMPNGNVFIAYIQYPVQVDELNLANVAPLPSMYIAEINLKGKIIQDVPVIGGEDPNRSYLQAVPEQNDVDPLKTTMILLPKTKEVLISVQNKGVNLNVGGIVNSGYPRIYRVKLP